MTPTPVNGYLYTAAEHNAVEQTAALLDAALEAGRRDAETISALEAEIESLSIPPVPPVVVRKFARPTLVNPTTINIAPGATSVKLDPAKDYILKAAHVFTNGLVIDGGRNISGSALAFKLAKDATAARSIYIKGATGTVDLEGIDIDHLNGRDGDGIAISAPNATVQIQNSRIANIIGSQDGVHGDVVQPWGGVKILRVWRLYGSSNYQGLFLRPDQTVGTDDTPAFKIDEVDVDKVLLDYAPAQGVVNEGGYLLWLTTGDTETAGKVTLGPEVYIGAVRSGKTVGTSVWPHTQTATWPNLPAVSGGVKAAPAQRPSFVVGTPGLGYVAA